MKIINANLAGVTLAIGTETATGDEKGVFDLPKEAAEKLLATAGWTKVKKAREPENLGPEVDAAVDAVTLPEGDGEEVDLDTLTKAELTALAEDHGIALDDRATKAQIKTLLEEALGGGD